MTQVSAIIACHNGEPFIARAIDSCLAQDVPDLEVVVADDASSDRCAEIAAAYGAPVRLVRTANHNTQATRNAAITASTGTLIGILDQDDAWLPGKLRRQIDCLEADPALGLCYTDTRGVDAHGAPLPERQNPMFCPGDHREALARLIRINTMAASTVLIRRSALDRVGLFDPAFHLAGDWDLWLRITEAFPIAGIPEPLVDYCWHGENLSRNRIGMLSEAIAVQSAALERIGADPRWGADPRLAPALEAARRKRASRYSELGSVLSKAGERARALEALGVAVREDPTTARHWSRLLRAWARPGRGRSAGEDR